MSRSVLLQLARDSIQEVLEAKNSIDKTSLLKLHPLLSQNIPTTVNIFIEDELKGTYSNAATSLLDNIILGAKKAAFEDKSSSVISTREYLHCEIELILKTDEGVISERDPAILKN